MRVITCNVISKYLMQWLTYVFLIINRYVANICISIIVNPINSYTRSSLLLFKFVDFLVEVSVYYSVVRRAFVQRGVSKYGSSAVSCFRR